MPSVLNTGCLRGIVMVGAAAAGLIGLGCGSSDGGLDDAIGTSGSAAGGTNSGGTGPKPTGGTGGPGAGGNQSGAGNSTGNAGGSDASGTSGASAGGTSTGGVNTGGTSNGGRNAGGTSGGTSAGASNSGGTSAGGGGAGAGGTPSTCGATGFHVRDGILYDVKCKEFVMRGVNYPYTWFASRNLQQDLSAIAATGANTVRIVMASGGRWTKTTAANLTSLINAMKAAKLVSVLEVHDTTGYSEQMGSVELTNATSYWTGSDISTVLKGQEAYVIVNIGNEPNGNNTSTTWASSHVTAVQALRNAGLKHTLMVDGPNWGQDYQNTMRDGGGASIWNADTERNLVFSVHMYQVYEMASTVSSYFNTFLMRNEAPLVVGEFAADHGDQGDVDEAAIMSFAETLGIGYLGWSWAGNGDGLGSLDITNDFNASSLTTWGTRLINGQNGIKSTSQPCSCFD